jgi:hypothetical protein
MVYFPTKNPNLGKFCRALELKRLVFSMEYLTDFWYILWLFGNLVAIWYIFRRFGILRQEKSGNPVTIPSESGAFVLGYDVTPFCWLEFLMALG